MDGWDSRGEREELVLKKEPVAREKLAMMEKLRRVRSLCCNCGLKS